MPKCYPHDMFSDPAHTPIIDSYILRTWLICFQAGANVNMKRFDGNTPLHVACGRENVGMVALLMAGKYLP